MTSPISVTADLQVRAGYVRYVAGDVARTIDVWQDGAVAADLDADDHVLGIEVLAFDMETLDAARRFANDRDLAFLAHLEGVLVAA